MLIEAFIYYFWLPNGAWEPPYTANMKARAKTRAYFIKSELTYLPLVVIAHVSRRNLASQWKKKFYPFLK